MNIKKLGNTDINVVHLREDLDLGNEEIITVYSSLKKKIFWVKNDLTATLYLWEQESSYKVITTFNNIELSTLRIDYLNNNFLTYEYFNEGKLQTGVIDLTKNSHRLIYQTDKDVELLFLTPDYLLIKDANEAGWFEEDKWTYDLDKEHLYLFDVKNELMNEIFDIRLKDSFFTKYNYFISNNDGVLSLVHVPYNKDAYEEEPIYKNKQGKIEFICAILLNDLLEALKTNQKELKLEIIKELKEHEYVFENNGNGYLYYDFNRKNIKVIKIDNTNFVETGKEFNYAQVPQLMDLSFVQNEFVYFDEGNTVFIDRDYHPIEHGLKDTFTAFDANTYIFSSWTEDFDADIYEDWFIVRDVTGKILHKEMGYVEYDRHLNILFVL